VRLQAGRGSLGLKIGITLTVLTLSACSASASGSQPPKPSTSTPPSSATTSSTSAGSPLSSLVAATPKGFTSEATDKDSGGSTGTQGINEADSADCDSGQVRQDHWVASQLRYFDDNPAYPKSYLLLCVTQLSSMVNAVDNQKQVVTLTEGEPSEDGLPAPTRFSVPAIAGGAGFVRFGGLEVQVTFAKGSYYVFVAGASVTKPGWTALRSVVTALATTQYDDLSK
jgi:hypothetical protein